MSPCLVEESASSLRRVMKTVAPPVSRKVCNFRAMERFMSFSSTVGVTLPGSKPPWPASIHTILRDTGIAKVGTASAAYAWLMLQIMAIMHRDASILSLLILMNHILITPHKFIRMGVCLIPYIHSEPRYIISFALLPANHNISFRLPKRPNLCYFIEN